MNTLHIFICHYTPLKERKKFILKQLTDKIGNLIIKDLECEFDKEGEEYKSDGYDDTKPVNYVYFVRKYDRKYLTPEIKNKYFVSPHDARHNIRLEYYSRPNYNKIPITYDNFTSVYKHSLSRRGRKPAEESLALKHYEAMRLISTMDISYGLIIEDDCVFADNFLVKLNKKMEEFPDYWDIYYPNSCPRPGFRVKGGSIKINNTNKIYIKKHPATVFGISYLITKQAASSVSKEIEENKIWLPIDHEHNWLFYKLGFKVIWNLKSPRLTFWGASGFKSSLI